MAIATYKLVYYFLALWYQASIAQCASADPVGAGLPQDHASEAYVDAHGDDDVGGGFRCVQGLHRNTGSTGIGDVFTYTYSDGMGYVDTLVSGFAVRTSGHHAIHWGLDDMIMGMWPVQRGLYLGPGPLFVNSSTVEAAWGRNAPTAIGEFDELATMHGRNDGLRWDFNMGPQGAAPWPSAPFARAASPVFLAGWRAL